MRVAQKQQLQIGPRTRKQPIVIAQLRNHRNLVKTFGLAAGFFLNKLGPSHIFEFCARCARKYLGSPNENTRLVLQTWLPVFLGSCISGTPGLLMWFEVELLNTQ